MFKKNKKDTSNVEENITIPDDAVFSKEDFENLDSNKKWYLSNKVIIPLIIALPASVFAGPVVFMILLCTLLIFLILISKEYSKSFVFIKEKMFEANKIYSEDIPKAKDELNSLKTDIGINKTNLREVSKDLNSIKDELKIYEKDYDSKVKFVEEYNEKEKNYDNLVRDINNIKKEIETISYLKNHLEETEAEVIEVNKKLEQAKSELIETNDEVLLQSFGLYEPKYAFENSEQYMEKLKQIRDVQKRLIKTKDGVSYYDGWIVNDSKKEGEIMTNKNIQSAFKLFNSECDIVINKVTYRNIDSSVKRIKKSFEQVNKLND